MSASKARRGPEIGRRTLLASLATVTSAQPTAQGAVLAECAAWTALNLEIDRLTSRWAALEQLAARNPKWFVLTPAQRLAMPEAVEMAAIDAALEAFSSQSELRLAAIGRLRSLTLHDIAGKLAVAARLMRLEEHPAHSLVEAATRELARARCPACGSPYIQSGFPRG